MTGEWLLGLFGITFSGSLLLTPPLLRHLRRRGFVVPDMYKPGGATVVTHAGLLGLGATSFALVATFLLRPPSLFLSQGYGNPSDPIVAAQLALFTICGYGVIGAIDDRHSLSHLVKAAVPLTLAVPVAYLAWGRPEVLESLSWAPFLGSNTPIWVFIVVPLYILVVTNLVNMHSGYNGLQSGLTLILLGTLLFRLTMEGRILANLPLLVVAGCQAAFVPFNRYPARAFEGNVGSFLTGAAIGVGIAANGLFIAGTVMLIPHIVDFGLFAYAKLRGYSFVKFGGVRPDGTIEAPYPFKLKFLLPYYFRLTERQAVRLLYALTAAAAGLSLLIPF